MNYKSKILITIAALIIFAGVNYAQEISEQLRNKVIAKVGDELITADEFLQSYEFGPAFIKRGKDSKQKHLEFMINERLLTLYGKDIKVDTTLQVNETIAAFESDLATEEMYKNEILPKVRYDDKEVDSVITKKQIELDIRWLYGETKDDMIGYKVLLDQNISFDSLYGQQLNSEVFNDMRSMSVSRYDLDKKNPALAQIIDTLRAGNYTAPIKTEDGWYIVKLDNIITNVISTEEDYSRLKNEAVNAVKKKKMDVLSDEFVKEIFANEQPVIQKDVFNVALAYIAKLSIDDDKYAEWNIPGILENALSNLNNPGDDEIGNQTLVNYANGQLSLNDFLIWFRNRSMYIKMNKTNLNSFGYSLHSIVWRMIRDAMLSKTAYAKGYYDNENVQRELSWWKNKIIYSAAKNEIAKNIFLNRGEINTKGDDNATDNEKMQNEISLKFHFILKEMKEKNKIEIDEDVLNNVKVSDQNDPTAPEFYFVKKGGLIPRTPYPTIDIDWQNW